MIPSATAASRPARLRRLGLSAILACALSVVATTVSAAPVPVGPEHAPAPAAPSVIGLKRGARGEPVKVVQQALIRAGVRVPGGADGIFGPATEQAVRNFQRARSKRVTGVVDAPTAQALGLTSNAASLAVGARGDAVKRMQQALINAGVRVAGGADGVFGPATQSAVRAYQRARGLQSTGAIDGATAAALGLGGQLSTPAAAGASTPGGYVGLRLGSRGDAVKAVQRAIMATGLYLRGGADGAFGTATQSALMLVQRVNGIPTTGVVDAATVRVLQLERAAPTTPAMLQRGARGNAVKLLQQQLLSAGIRFAGGADGIFGPATEAAVRQFQSSKGLAVTGRVDERTASALRVGGQPAPSPSSGYVGLRLGSRGENVKAVQRAIMATGMYLRGGADGIFGTATQSALMIYQRTNGLGASGAVDAATARLMGLGASTPPPSGTARGFAVYDERGARVVALQTALIRAGIDVRGGADGMFGSGTAAAVMAFQRARGLSATGRVDQATANALGLSPMDRPTPTPPPSSVQLDAKPVQGPCWMADSWHAPRGNGRVHLGVDIIAGSGQQLYAVATGEISQIYRNYPGSLAGNGLKVRRPDGTYFFYAHLSRFAPGIRLGTDVRAGQVVGYVGSTGNSATPHLHLEVHPGGGAAINPYPIVKAIGAC